METADGAEGLNCLKTHRNLVLCDIKMPKIDGNEFFAKALKINPDVPVIMISGHGTIETAVEAGKKRHFDFFIKTT